MMLCCLSVHRGLGSVDPESLVQALLDADICAELSPQGEGSADITKVANKNTKVSPSFLNDSHLSPEVEGGCGSSYNGSEAGVLSAVASGKSSSTHHSSSFSIFDEGDDNNKEEDVDSWGSFGRQRLHDRGRNARERLGLRRLVFPSLLTELETFPHGGKGGYPGDEGWDWVERFRDKEAFVFGRRVACRSPLLTPGLFHSLQARLANR